ncbi:MAG: flagellar protein export ATPase FliI [Candidatus Zixiibacteriota bacterium]|nr:MAG: flagellar protein export ATPase FliI [candidate division Zixibacteria bacterium]
MKSIPYDHYAALIDRTRTIKQSGRVAQIIGLVIESVGPAVSIGDLCQIENPETCDRINAEVVGFRDNRILLMPFGSVSGITPGSAVISTGQKIRVPVGDELIGRIVNGMGQPIDGRGPILSTRTRSIDSSPIHALKRKRITEAVRTGIKVVDIMATCGRGQRMGIFAGSGVGKSLLLGMIARGSTADVNVIALVGERGREVRQFIENDLGPEGLKRSVVVVATSDQPALVRIKGASVATAIAEHFRDQGMDVMLLMDSLTRIAIAQREIGLAVGEPPATKGFTPSVFAMLPRMLERAGTNDKGSITGMYAVLVEGDDFNEPISDAVRSILDGHISLSRKLASLNQYPAVDVIDSISRLMVDVSTPEHLDVAARTREIVATYRESEDLINIGAYVKGSSSRIDYAISKIDDINRFFRQSIHEKCRFEDALKELANIIPPDENRIEDNEEVQVPAGEDTPA